MLNLKMIYKIKEREGASMLFIVEKETKSVVAGVECFLLGLFTKNTYEVYEGEADAIYEDDDNNLCINFEMCERMKNDSEIDADTNSDTDHTEGCGLCNNSDDTIASGCCCEHCPHSCGVPESLKIVEF